MQYTVYNRQPVNKVKAHQYNYVKIRDYSTLER